MRAMHGMKAFMQPDDEMPSMQDLYAGISARANEALRTAGVVLSVVAVLWFTGGVLVLVALGLMARYYLKHHRIPGTLVRYEGHGDWVIVALPDGTEIIAHSTLARLPEGTDVVVAIRRDGAYVIAPPVRHRQPEPEQLVEVVDA